MNKEMETRACSSCGYEYGQLLKVTMNNKEGWLCELCRLTTAGNAFFYPEQHPQAETLRMLAYCTNRILFAVHIRG